MAVEPLEVVNQTLFGNGTNITRSYVQSEFKDIEIEDTNWILTSSFIIFTMQTGFGMLESGCVSIKNEANIMMKNLVDIVLGGMTYWIFGYGMSFGESPPSLDNSFVALGDFFVDPSVGDESMGPIFASFLFQLSFATTATTIVSGAMAERCNFKAYCIFSFLNTIVYCVPAGWVWGSHGFLYKMGVVDIAGSGPVHLIGGASAFASALMLGPRLGRYSKGTDPLPLGSPVNAVMGLFVLWWGWLAFNSGSTYGVSGSRWQYAARAAVMTMMGSFGGGILSLFYTMIKNKGKADVIDLINGVLGALVSVTAGCFLYCAWEALLIGCIGGLIACVTMPLFDMMKVDDPVGASSVHGCAGIWGVIAVGLFADNPIPLDTTRGRSGLFKGGGWYLLGVQSLSATCLCVWSILVTMLLLWLIDRIIPIRMDPYEELLGADLTEHNIRHGQVGVSRALSALRPYHEDKIEEIATIGQNPRHHDVLEKFYKAAHTNGEKNLTPQESVHPHHHNPDTSFERRKSKSLNAKHSHRSITNKRGFLKAATHANNFNMKLNEIASKIDLEQANGSNSPSLRNRLKSPPPVEINPEDIKDLDIKDLNTLSSMDDRSGRLYKEENYENDFQRAKFAWID